MIDYVSSALFVYTKDTAYLSPRLIDNACGATITPVSYDEFRQDPQAMLTGIAHIVVSGDYEVIKTILSIAMQYSCERVDDHSASPGKPCIQVDHR